MDNNSIPENLNDLVALDIPQEIINLVDRSIINDYQLFPVKILKRRYDLHSTLLLATARLEENSKNIPILEDLLGLPVHLAAIPRDTLDQAAYHYLNMTIRYIDAGFTIKGMDEVVEQEYAESSAEDSRSPVVNRVNEIIQEAIKLKASDIHIDPWDNLSKVWFRINGDLIDLSEKYPISRDQKASVINIVKNMCKPGLDITLKHMEQKGQFFVDYEGKLYDCRVAVLPTIRQEKITIRVLDPDKIVLTLDQLGYEMADLIRYEKRITKTSGLIFFVAPTGQGKTTAMYATLKACGYEENKVFAIEDPPEYRVEGITQIPIRENRENENLNWTYLKAIEATLRNDLDILLIGETRGAKEATAVLNASKTGHLVLSTLHARDSTMAIPRLFDMGIDRRSLLAEMLCVVAQRLVKLNCPHCSVPYTPSDRAMMHLTSKEKERILKGNPKKSKGCSECKNVGRKAIAEFLFFDNDLRDYLSDNRGIVEMLDYLKNEKGFVSMWDKGIELVVEGEITLETLVKSLDRNEDDNEELRELKTKAKEGAD